MKIDRFLHWNPIFARYVTCFYTDITSFYIDITSFYTDFTYFDRYHTSLHIIHSGKTIKDLNFFVKTSRTFLHESTFDSLVRWNHVFWPSFLDFWTTFCYEISGFFAMNRMNFLLWIVWIFCSESGGVQRKGCFESVFAVKPFFLWIVRAKPCFLSNP